MNCPICSKQFEKKFNLDRHIKTHNRIQTLHACEQCPYVYSSKEDLLSHIQSVHTHKRKASSQETSDHVKRSRNTRNRRDALNTFSEIQIEPHEEENMFDVLKFFNQVSPEIQAELELHLEEKRSIKWFVVLRAVFSRTTSDGEIEYSTPHLRSNNQIDLTADTIAEHIQEAISKIQVTMDEYTKLGSGWELEYIKHIVLSIATYEPLAASSYIPLPSKLAAKKAVLNIQNNDQKCLVWCLLAHKMNISREDNANRVSHYIPFESDIKLGNIQCPVPVSQIPKIESLNNLRINVYGYEENVFPLYISPKTNPDVINLLLIENEDASHYCLIRNFSRLLGDLTKHHNAAHYCYRCLHRFTREDLLRDHIPYCKQHSPQRIKMPQRGEHILKFDNVHYQQTIPYVFYCDFESLIVPEEQAQDVQNTEKISHHEACGYALLIVGPDGNQHKPIMHYRGPNAVEHFLDVIMKEKQEIAEIITNITPIIMTPQDEQNFKSASTCYLCQKPLKGDRVRDHDHLTGQYRGPLHNRCNLKYRLTKKIPVIFHNLKHYDGHLIMQHLGKVQGHEFHVIPTTMEKYTNFSLNCKHGKCDVSLSFIDSFQFMPSSLQTLVENLDADEFSLLKAHFPSHTELLLKKGIYPYEYMDKFEKFEEKQLPPKSAFYSTLTGEEISLNDYQHAQNVWTTFQVTDLGAYHDLYVQTDVLQLADVFQNFRKLCQQYYNLDCVHMLTAPGLAWQSSLKMCDTPLELLTDVDMHLLFEKGIRGGISTITKRSAEANNQHLPNYNPEEASKYIMYLDCNNLYGWAMSQALPYGKFEWVSTEHMSAQWIQSLSPSGPEGYIFEVDLEYPEHLHEDHNDYPLAAEKLKIMEEDLSEYSKEALQEQKYIPSTKLVPNLKNKQNYVVYYKNLQFYLKMGLILKKVHKAIKFQEKAWLKPYISFNTEQRKKAKSTFEKNFFKLMNNAVYGKSMENVRKHRNVTLVNTEKKGKKLVASPAFKKFLIFDNDLVAVERIKQTMTLNKPIYMGFVILELSKLMMYDYHYNVIKKQYGPKAQLLFTDTDSLTYEVETHDFYQDMASFPDIYDTSDYPTDHPLHSTINKKKIGCFKDELNSTPIQEFIGLRAKMYSILSSAGEKKTAKGVSRRVVEKKIKHMHYKNCLRSLKKTREVQHRIQSEKHHLYTIKNTKIALSPFDDKRHILGDGVHTLALGHFKIKAKK